MISIVEQPNNPSWSNNCLNWKFQSTNADGTPYAGVGESATLCFDRFTPDCFFATGDTFIIDWTDGTQFCQQTFTASANPTNPFEFYSWGNGPSSWSLLQYMGHLKLVLQSHTKLSDMFYILLPVTEPCIKVVAKEVDIKYAIEFVVLASSDCITHYTSNITPDSTPENYKVCVDVYFQSNYPDGPYDRVVTLEDTIDGEGCTTFNLQHIIHPELKCSKEEPQLPPLNAAPVNEPYIADNVRCYYISYYEKSGNPIQPSNPIISAPQRVIAGGVDAKAFAKGDDLLSTFDNTNSMLSNMPRTREVGVEQPLWLHWYNYTSADVTTMIQVDFFDSTSPSPVGSFTTPHFLPVGSAETMTLPAGMTNLGLNTVSTEITKYCVQVKNMDTAAELSPKCWFIVDCYCHPCIKYLTYISNFCLPEQVRLLGHTSKDLDIERNFSDRNKGKLQQMQQWSEDWTNVYTCRTGYLPKAEVDALQEMLIFNQLFLEENGDYCPYVMTTNKFNITECLQFLHSLSFEAMPAEKSLNFQI